MLGLGLKRRSFETQGLDIGPYKNTHPCTSVSARLRYISFVENDVLSAANLNFYLR